MKIRSVTSICRASIVALSLAVIPGAHAQMTTPSTANPTGSEADSKAKDSTAQETSSSTGTGTSPASAPEMQDSKATTNALDKNPSTAPTDSADKQATKDVTTTTTTHEKSTSSTGHFTDKKFMMKAAQGGMTEVELGKLAQQNGSSEDVKAFGARMVTDHSKANDDLMALAKTKGVTLPSALDTKHQAMVDKMSKMSGAAFDKSYVDAMVTAHEKDAADFDTASTSAHDPDLKAFAAKTLDMVKMHLSDIQAIQAKMK